jgi:hypothetical protein
MVCLSKVFIYPFIVLHMKDSTSTSLQFLSLEGQGVISAKVNPSNAQLSDKIWEETASSTDSENALHIVHSPLLILSYEPSYPIYDLGDSEFAPPTGGIVGSVYAIYATGILEYPSTCFIASALVFDEDQIPWDKPLTFKPSPSLSCLLGNEYDWSTISYLP